MSRLTRPSSFPADRMAVLAAMERDHFWFVGRRELLSTVLRRHLPASGAILDLGCGTGSLRGELGGRAIGLDLHRTGLAPGRGVQADAERLPFASGSLAAVVALDLIEHVDDARTLNDVADALQPGGVLIVSVPALPLLWSHRDVEAGHLRRYTSASLTTVLRAAGLRVVDVRPYLFLLLPLLALGRLLHGGRRWRDREDRPGGLINALLRPVARLDGWLGARLRWPVGSSLVAVARSDA